MEAGEGATNARGGWRERGAAQARLQAGGAHAGLLGGSPLSLLQGIIPGNPLPIAFLFYMAKNDSTSTPYVQRPPAQMQCVPLIIH